MKKKYKEVIEIEECKQAVMLARVSSRKQERGASLEAQVEAIQSYCKRNNLIIIEPTPKAFVFAESSTRGGRKKFNEMIEFIEKQKNKTAIVVHTLDRLQRGFEECEKIKELLKADKIEVHFIVESLILDKFSTDDEFTRYDFGILSAKLYLTSMNKNVKRSQKHNREAGLWQGLAPIGYLNAKDERRKPTLILDPERAPIIKQIFEEYASGVHSLKSVWLSATEKGLISKEPNYNPRSKNYGKYCPVSRNKIHDILTNPFYYGAMYVADEEIDERTKKPVKTFYKLINHVYEPLISKELFDKVQKVLKTRKKERFCKEQKYASIPFVFRGLDASNVFGRGLTSQNILSQLRNLLEAINMYFFANNKDIEYTYENIEKANAYIKANARLRLLSKFHHLLQISASHYTLEQDCSERLMLKYYEYLINIKHLMKNYGIDILNNLNKFPINTDRTLQIFYEKISEKIETPSFLRKENEYSDRYYIQKITPFFINQNIYYEITFILANDYASKFDRIIAFSKHNILDNYAVKLNIHTEYIDILNYSMPILIIDDWEIAIRQCEINHFSDIFENNLQINTNTKSFKYLMSYLKDQHLNLLDFILLPDYIAEKSKIIENYGVSKFFDILDKSREIILKSSYGCNVLRYLLYTLNNRIIKLQLSDSSCNLLSNLYLTPQSIPFDRMPFCSSLKGHNPSIYNLLFCIDYEGKEHELFARFIKNNSEQNASLYYSLQDTSIKTENIDDLISKYNNSLHSSHRPLRQLEKFKDFVFLNEYEYNVYNIIKKLKELSSFKITGYTEATQMWIDENPNAIDCPEKKNI